MTVIQNPSVITDDTDKVSIAWKKNGKAHGQIFTRSEFGDKVCIYSIGDEILRQDKASTDGTIRPLRQDRLDVYPNFVSPDTDFHSTVLPGTDNRAEMAFNTDTDDDTCHTMRESFDPGEVPEEVNRILSIFSHDRVPGLKKIFMGGQVGHTSNGELFQDNQGLCRGHSNYYYSSGTVGNAEFKFKPEEITGTDKSLLLPSNKEVEDLAQKVGRLESNIVDRSNA